MIRLRASPVILHITAWLSFMTLPLLFMNQGQPLDNLTGPRLFPYLQFCGLYISLFYLHANWLIPRYFLRKKYRAYVLALLLLLLAVYSIRPFDNLMRQNQPVRQQPDRTVMHRPPPPDRPGHAPPPQNPFSHFDITSIFIFIMIIGLGSAFQSIKQWQLYERRAILAEAEKANAELSFLKAQINPHFLYNTLNNIYILCLTNGQKAAESILKLSSIMRYITDESEADFVPLKDEIDCINNFIALQQLRLGEKVILRYTVEGDPSAHRITPLLLMTFIENALKYGLSNHLEATITITIKIEAQQISFSAENQLFGHKAPQKRKGIGIENTKKRLAHLYPDAHTLQISESSTHYKVILILDSK